MKKNTTVSIEATTFHDFSGKTLGGGTRENPTEGAEISYSKFRGKVVLINNVATM
jgi:glutathione peroxidase